MSSADGCSMKSHVEGWNAVVTLRTAAHLYFIWKISFFVSGTILRHCNYCVSIKSSGWSVVSAAVAVAVMRLSEQKSREMHQMKIIMCIKFEL